MKVNLASNSLDVPVLEIVSDVDEVFVYIAPKWTSLIISDKTMVSVSTKPEQIAFLQHLLEEGNLAEFWKQVCLRKEYYLNDWLGIPKEYMEDFMAHYISTAFYSNLIPSKLGLAIMKLVAHRGARLTLISNCIAGTEEAKQKWLKNILGGLPVKLVMLPIDTSKADYVKEEQPRLNEFIDDKLESIYDVANVLKGSYNYSPSINIIRFGYVINKIELLEKLDQVRIDRGLSATVMDFDSDPNL